MLIMGCFVLVILFAADNIELYFRTVSRRVICDFVACFNLVLNICEYVVRSELTILLKGRKKYEN